LLALDSRFTLFGVFAMLGLTLAVMGVTASSRTRWPAARIVRMALGDDDRADGAGRRGQLIWRGSSSAAGSAWRRARCAG
jgi:hypothetical protein